MHKRVPQPGRLDRVRTTRREVRLLILAVDQLCLCRRQCRHNIGFKVVPRPACWRGDARLPTWEHVRVTAPRALRVNGRKTSGGLLRLAGTSGGLLRLADRLSAFVIFTALTARRGCVVGRLKKDRNILHRARSLRRCSVTSGKHAGGMRVVAAGTNQPAFWWLPSGVRGSGGMMVVEPS